MDLGDYLPILMFAVFFGIAGVGILIAVLRERKRREAWCGFASETGFVYTQEDRAFGQALGFDLFQRGHRRRARNVLSGEAQGTRVALADYQYTTGGGKNSSTHRRSVVVLESEGLDLPRFAVRPEHFFDRFAELVGMDDIDFDEDPDFSSAYLLKGEDEESVRQTFGPPVRAHLVANAKQFRKQGLYVEGASQALLVSTQRRVRPAEATALIETAFTLLALWTHT